LAESNLKHLLKSRESAVKLVSENNNWIKIDCADKKNILPVEEIHGKQSDGSK
jgi:hypothetical protein